MPKNLIDPSFRREDQISSPTLDEAKVFVGGLCQQLSESELKEAFEKFGKVTDAVVMRDRETNQSKGFGFVTFSTKAEAKRAAYTGSILIGKRKVITPI